VNAFIVAALIAAAALAAILPMFWLGLPSGHDFEFHVNSWMEVASQWRHGILYPRWAAMANFGYGEPRFIFYPPASWILGAALGSLLPWWLVPIVYVWIVLTAAGWSMFVLARNFLSAKHAVFAAMLYAVNPYHLIIVYWRSAFAELMAAIWLPLLLLWVLRLESEGRKAILFLAMVMAAVWLTNAPSAVMANYSLVLLVATIAVLRRSPRLLLYGALACLLGIGLAAFYVLPAAYEQRWVTIEQVLAPGVRPYENFLFTVIKDADHNRFNLLVSIVAVLEIAVLALAGLLSRRKKQEQPAFWWSITIWSATIVLLMLPVSILLWKYLPQLRFIQLPWRWLLCMNVAFALFVSLGMRRWAGRFAVALTMLIGLAAVWRFVQPPWWDDREDVANMNVSIQDGDGYESVYEYIPRGGNLEGIDKSAPLVSCTQCSGEVQIDRWAPDERDFSVDANKPAQLTLRLFDYPSWKIEVNGKKVIAEKREDTGQMVIPIQPGKNLVLVIFTRTWDRFLGAIISAAAAIAVFLLVALVTPTRLAHRPESAEAYAR